MVFGVTNEEVAVTGSYAVRIIELPRPMAFAAETRNWIELAITRIESLQNCCFPIQEIEDPTGTQCHVAGGG
jgi:hypothetical protein